MPTLPQTQGTPGESESLLSLCLSPEGLFLKVCSLISQHCPHYHPSSTFYLLNPSLVPPLSLILWKDFSTLILVTFGLDNYLMGGGGPSRAL